MRTSPSPPIGPDDAERLLATGRDAAYPGLSRLLTAAAAPPRPGELAGLRAAVAAFEEAARHEWPAAALPRRRALRPLAAVAALAAMFAGGVALATETGTLPGAPVTGRTSATGAPPETTRPAPSHSTPADPRTPGNRGRALSPTSPAAGGLCRAWEAHQRNPRKDPATAEAMRDLAAVAGGEDRIPAFCAPLLAGPATPSHPGKGPGKPPPSPAKKG